MTGGGELLWARFRFRASWLWLPIAALQAEAAGGTLAEAGCLPQQASWQDRL